MEMSEAISLVELGIALVAAVPAAIVWRIEGRHRAERHSRALHAVRRPPA
jgi:hypothetical protein